MIGVLQGKWPQRRVVRCLLCILLSCDGTGARNRVDELRDKLHIDFEPYDLGNRSPSDAAEIVLSQISSSLQDRLSKTFAKATSSECRAKIAQHLGYFVNAIGKEESLPFTDVEFTNECDEPVYDWTDLPEGMHIGDIQNRTYQPPRNETVYLDDPSDLKLLYGILTHDDPVATIRLIDVLYEEGHQFVIHVDARFDDKQQSLLKYSADKHYVHVLPDTQRA